MLKHERLAAWLEEIGSICKPDSLVLCDGSETEYNNMMELLLESGAASKLNETKRPNSYLIRSDPADVARVESRTFICTDSKEDAGPNNNWEDPEKMKDNRIFGAIFLRLLLKRIK